MKKKIFIFILSINAVILYLLEGILFNPLFIWVLLPFYIGYSMVYKAWKINSKKKLWKGYNFLVASIGFSHFYHLLWFFDAEGTKTGGSTTALIFLWGPIWAVVLGYFGYFIGSFVENQKEV